MFLTCDASFPILRPASRGSESDRTGPFDANDLNKIPLTLQVKFLRRVLDTVFARLQKSNAQRWLASRDKSKKDSTRTLDPKP